jgi:ubiquinone biosynthesis protein UbiJ
LSESHPLFAGSLSESLRHLIRSHLAEAPGGSNALLKLEGRVIAFHLKPFDRWLYLCPTREDVQILTEISGTPDVTFHGTLAAFIEVSLHPGDTGTVRKSGLVIDGDMALAQDFQALSAALGIDWQRFLSRYLGDQLAGSTLGMLRSGRDWLKKSAKALESDLSEYLREETRWLPDASETDPHLDAVDALRSDIDRLTARIDRLETTLRSRASPKRKPKS